MCNFYDRNNKKNIFSNIVARLKKNSSYGYFGGSWSISTEYQPVCRVNL